MNCQFKNLLKQREVILGSWIQIGHSISAEILAEVGFDCIVIDCEHTDIGVDGVTTLIRAMHGRSVAPLVRVRENNTLFIRQVLDAGACGIIVPLINNADEAKRAVLASRFPPEGIRGFAYFRANNWGVDFDAYIGKANQEIVVIAMIETKQAVENIDEILMVDGIDGIFIGPCDMSGSYGVTGQVSHPLLLDAYKKISDACRKHNKAAGLHLVKPDLTQFTREIKNGFSFFVLGMDTVYLTEMARNVFNMAKATVNRRRKDEKTGG